MAMKSLGITAFFGLLLLSLQAFAQPSAAHQPQEVYPVENLKAQDMPYDAGGAVLLTWKAMPYDSPEVFYSVYVSTDKTAWFPVAEFESGKKLASDIKLPFWAWKADNQMHALSVDLSGIYPNAGQTSYYFWVTAKKGGAVSCPIEPPQIVSAVPKGNWFNLARLNNMLFVIVISGIFLWAIAHAKRNELFIRRIAGLDAVDEAIGRATEMGRPIYYTTGIGSMGQMSTIASTFVLGEISKKVASYDSRIKVPHYDPIVMSVCKEVVKQAYTEAGRPDSYREDINFFVSQDQFSYVASVDGMIAREKPAACFYMGYFMAESLLLTEVGATTGAIQIAGTDVESQLPFFFTSCDYTLIGEELYAAGAYLSKDPILVGTLRAQDIAKAFVMAVVILGTLTVTIGSVLGWTNFVAVVMHPFNSF